MSAQGSDEAPSLGVQEPAGPVWALGWLAALLAGLALVGAHNFPVFHTLAEIFCLVIASSLFILILPMRRLLDSHYVLFVAIGAAFVAVVGIPHILSYAGVHLLPGFGNDLPTQAFIVQRTLLAGTFLIAPLFLERKLRVGPVVAAFAAVTVVALLAMLLWRDFPHMYVDGVGPTPLKQASDLLLAATFTLSAWLLWRRRSLLDPSVWKALLVTLGCFAVSDLFFSTFGTPFSWSNLVGHLFQVSGFYFLYRAVLVTALVNPFAVLFRELTFREHESERLFAIESQRAQRMALLKEIADAGGFPLEMAEAAQRQLETLARGLHTRTAVILLVDEQGRSLVPLAGVGYPEGRIREEPGPVALDGPGLSAQVFRSGDTSVVEDVDTDPTLSDATRGFLRSLGVASAVKIPLSGVENIVGVLSLDWAEPHPFDAEERAFLESVASQISIGLQNSRLYGEEHVRAARMAALKEFAELGVSSFGPDELAGRLAALLPGLLGADRILITMRTDVEGVYHPIGSHGWLSTDVAAMTPVPAGSPILDVYTTGRMTVVEDTQGEGVPESVRERAGRFGSRAVLVAPLLVGGDVIGTLSVAWRDPRAFRREESEFLSSVAAEAAIALQNARLFDAEREARAAIDAELATTRILLEAARELTTLDPVEALSQFARLALESTGLSRAHVNLIDTDGRVLTPLVVIGAGSVPRGGPASFDAIGATLLRAITAKQTTLLDFDRQDVTDVDREAAPPGMRFALFVPFLVAGGIVGQITLDDPGERHDFSAKDIAVVEGMAAQVALVVRNAVLYEEAQRHAASEGALAAAAGVLASSLEASVQWPEVLALAVRAVDAKSGILMLREGGGWRSVATVGLPEGAVTGFHKDADTPTLMRVLRTRESVFVADVAQADPVVGDWAAKLGYGAFVTTPVLAGGEVVAALILTFERPRSRIGEDESNAISRIAFMVGMAEANARLYRREHEIAETLQEGLLALPSGVPGVEFKQAYRSATVGSKVGGDFYDVFQLSQQHVGITVGDVSGKGLNAAVVTALVRNTIRAHAEERGKTPARILSLTDDIVYRATPPETFVTVFFGILDTRDGRLVYANAAHTTGAVVHADGSVGDLGVTGPLLGAFPGVPYGESEAYVDPGDTLFLYTDGVTEARDGGALYGEDRLRKLLATLGDATLPDVVQTVISDVEEFSGSRLRDDVVILALRRATVDPQPQAQTKLPL